MKKKVVFGILTIIMIVSTVFVGVNATDTGASVPKTVAETKEVNKIEQRDLNTETQKDLIYSSKYLVKGKNICRIEPKTSVEEFRKNIEVAEGKEIKIYKGDKEIVSGYIGTGMKLREENGEEYTLSVKGDITGDGLASQIELTKIIRHLIELKDWKLEGAEALSADITGEGQINLVDVSKLINYIVYGRWEIEEDKKPVPNLTDDNLKIKYTTTEWTNGPVKVEIETTVEGDYKLQYSTDGENWKDYTGEIEMNENGNIHIRLEDSNGEVGDEVVITISNIDKEAPIVKLSPNGGSYVLPTTGKGTISTVLTAEDIGKSGLDTLQYAWSTSNSQEPTEWINFTNGSKVGKINIVGAQTYYLWTKVTDKAGNRATNVKVSAPFIISENADVANQITLTANPTETNWTNGNVTVTASFGSNLTQERKLTCTGTAGTDYVVNGSTSVVVKTNGKTVTAEAKDVAGNKIVATLNITNIDKTLPTVQLSPNGGSFILPATGGAKIGTTLTATDGEGSGLATLQYAWSTSNSQEPTEWINFTNGSKVEKINIVGAQTYYLWTKVIDNAGNRATNIKVSAPFIISANADVANQITLTANPTETNWTNGDVTVTASYGANLTQERNLTCTGTAGTDYVVNGSTSVVVKTNGRTVTAEAKDAAGNIVRKSLNISKIDKTAPVMNGLTASTTNWTNGNVTLTGKATDAQSGIVAYQFSQANNLTATSGGWVTLTTGTTSQITQTGTANANGTWYFYVKDAAGNVNKNSVVVYIDKTLPTMNSLTPSPATWTNGNVTLTGKATDAQSGIIAYQFSQTSNLTATSGGWTNLTTATKTQITQTGTANANGTWYFYVKDVAGNVNKSSVVVYIDKTVPVMNSLTATTTSWTNGNVILTGKATDTQSGIVAYQFSKADNITAGSGGWVTLTTPSTSQITQTGTATANGTWYFYVKDQAGNVNKNSIAVKIDKLAPTINTVTAGEITTSSIKITVAATDPVATTANGSSGIKSYYYSKDGGNTWTSAQTSASYTYSGLSSGTNYTFAVKVVDNAGNMSEKKTTTATTEQDLPAFAMCTGTPTKWQTDSIWVDCPDCGESGGVETYGGYYECDDCGFGFARPTRTASCRNCSYRDTTVTSYDFCWGPSGEDHDIAAAQEAYENHNISGRRDFWDYWN